MIQPVYTVFVLWLVYEEKSEEKTAYIYFQLITKDKILKKKAKTKQK